MMGRGHGIEVAPFIPNDSLPNMAILQRHLPTAMHVAIGMMERDTLLPDLRKLHAGAGLAKCRGIPRNIIKIGRTQYAGCDP